MTKRDIIRAQRRLWRDWIKIVAMLTRPSIVLIVDNGDGEFPQGDA